MGEHQDEGYMRAREGFMKTRAPEGMLAKATEEDDVEGHGMPAREGYMARATEDEGYRARATEDEGYRARATEDDDVEGHGMPAREGYKARATEDEGYRARATDDDDVEGHGITISPRTRGE